jgi:tripartite-type tricarboxylate transporter receptor subunit TctC
MMKIGTGLSRRRAVSTCTRSVLAAVLGISLLSTAASAQEYPTTTIQVVVPFAAGGGVDGATRIVAEAMGEILGQQLVIDNRGGGSTIIGTQSVTRAEPDGYTLLAAPTTLVINPALKPSLPYDWQTDLVPITLLAKLPFVVVAGQALPAGTMQELARLGQQSGEGLTFGSGGVGTVAHLAGELFGLRSGTRMLHVPYRGEAPALVDAIGGQISVMFSTLASASGQIQGGQLKPLAVTTKERASLLPDVPTVAEQGYPDYDLSAWIALMAPKGTSRPVIEKLNAAASEVLRRPAVRDRLAKLGAEPAGGTPEELASFMQKDAAVWAEVVRKAGVKVD